MNFDITPCTHFLVIAGSHAYGTNTPESDLDVKGWAIPPTEILISYIQNFEQNDTKLPLKDYPFKTDIESYLRVNKVTCQVDPVDSTIYNLRKFMALAADCNPNIIDLLFTKESEIIWSDFYGDELREAAPQFLSQRARYSFTGYAMSQLKRIHTHRRWITDPPKKKPEREDYGLPCSSLIPPDQRQAAQALIEKQVRLWLLEEAEVDKVILDQIQDDLLLLIGSILDLKTHEEARERVEYVVGKSYGMSEEYLSVLQQEKKYKSALNDFNSYQTWLENRNPARAQLEYKYGFDCYTDDTEFLTYSGWKLFDQITESDKLATVFLSPTKKDLCHRKHLGIEYQQFTDKYSSIYTGTLYHLIGNHIDTMVTPNHRMLIRTAERKSEKIVAPFHLHEMANLPDTFDILRAVNPIKKRFSQKRYFKGVNLDPAVYMALVGWFISEGSFTFYKYKPREIRISQKHDGRLSRNMHIFYKTNRNRIYCRLRTYVNKKNGFRKDDILELVLRIKDSVIVNKMYFECGHKQNKRLPKYIFKLSKRLKDALLVGLLGGDGTVRNTSFQSDIYYTSQKQLADDVQLLALSCGYETTLYGPYTSTYEYKDKEKEITMYQVHINRKTKLTRRLVRAKNVKKYVANEKRIVCFTTPNGTLITRRNGCIGIHGNSKHASHLCRLLVEAEEILEKGTLTLKQPEHIEFFKAIKNGVWSFDKLLQWSTEKMAVLADKNIKSAVPKTVDTKKLDQIYRDLVLSSMEEEEEMWHAIQDSEEG